MKSNVMVTGGTGYVGSWIVKELLERGYKVHLALRNKEDEEKIRHLKVIESNSPGVLSLWEADLLKEGSFESACKGCSYVIHSASPFILNFNDPQKELIDPALKGTQNVLHAASNSGSVEKVILTSSIAAIHGDNVDMKELGIKEFSETNFNSTSSLSHQPYSYSKVLAEKKAWELAKRQVQWQLVVINPALVMGPPLSQRSHSGSLTLMKELLGGKYRLGAPNLIFGFVDVRDVARAHVLAIENGDASGRYLLAERVCSIYDFSKMLKVISEIRYPLPVMKAPKFLMLLSAPAFGLTRKFVRRNVGHNILFNTSKSRNQLHLDYTPLEQTMKDMLARLKELQMIE